jgi:uridine kinase
MHTIIRDASTSKNDFVFFADRLSRLVVEAGLGHLPFHEKTVITPTGERHGGGRLCVATWGRQGCRHR